MTTRLAIPAAGLALACAACGPEAEDPHAHFLGVWNMVARHDVSSGTLNSSAMPVLDQRQQGGMTYCSGEFSNLELVASGVAFVGFGSVYGYDAGCVDNLEYSGRIKYAWEPLEGGELSEIGLYFDHDPGGDTTEGETGIPTRELVVTCTVEAGLLRCVDPVLGLDGGGNDFARPVCDSDADCGVGDLCFSGQCVVPQL